MAVKIYLAQGVVKQPKYIVAALKIVSPSLASCTGRGQVFDRSYNPITIRSVCPTQPVNSA